MDATIPDYGSQPDICTTIDAKLKCLEKYIGKCLNERGKQNIRCSNFPLTPIKLIKLMAEFEN